MFRNFKLERKHIFHPVFVLIITAIVAVFISRIDNHSHHEIDSVLAKLIIFYWIMATVINIYWSIRKRMISSHE